MTEKETKKPPYSGRITMGVAIMVAIGLFWLKFLPNYPMEIALVISIVIIIALLKDYWYRPYGKDSKKTLSGKVGV